MSHMAPFGDRFCRNIHSFIANFIANIKTWVKIVHIFKQKNEINIIQYKCI